MRKKKMIIIVSACLCLLLIAAGGILVIGGNKGEGGSNLGSSSPNNGEKRLVNLTQAKECFLSDIQALKEGKYPNLISTDFTAAIDEAEALYHFKILENQNRETTPENVEGMLAALEKFFGDSLDKNNLYYDAYPMDEDGESVGESIEISYDELMTMLEEEKIDHITGGFCLLGDYYADIRPNYSNTWLSKRTFGTSLPGDNIHNECLYVTGIRQEDAVIHLMDGEIQLAEMEKLVLDYVNGDDFPLPLHEEIGYDIGTVYIMTYEEGECVNFALRRVYQGVPFEYGSPSAGGEYIDRAGHDYTTLSYAVSTSPDTLMGFIELQGIIDEKEELTEMLTAGDALSLLSEQIGANSVYEVCGVELVYRNIEIPQEQREEVSDILEPKWKIITINQNDDKYTLFYVDVVTGEITERFEYYYD